MLIEDEAHRCIKNYDYKYIAQNYVDNSSHPRVMGLTASPGSDPSKIKEICRNLSIEEVELKTRESDDVKQYLQELKIERRIIDFPKELDDIRGLLRILFNTYTEELKKRKVFFEQPSKIKLIELQRKLMHLISVGNRNFNYLLAVSACSQAIKLPARSRASRNPDSFELQ